MHLLIIYNMRVWHASRDIYHVACTLVHIFWKCVQKLHWKPMCLVLINLELNMHRSGLVSDELFYDKATCCSLSQAAAHHRTHARSVSSADLLSSCIWTSTRKTQKMQTSQNFYHVLLYCWGMLVHFSNSGLVSDELFYDKATCCSLSQAAAQFVNIGCWQSQIDHQTL